MPISERMLKAIARVTEEDEVLGGFLRDLVFEESERSGQWSYKEFYRKKVADSVTQWRRPNENH